MSKKAFFPGGERTVVLGILDSTPSRVREKEALGIFISTAEQGSKFSLWSNYLYKLTIWVIHTMLKPFYYHICMNKND
jgi:hypothetical protein